MNIFYNIIFITSVFGMNNGNAFHLPKPNVKHNTNVKSVNDLYTSYYSPVSNKENIFIKEEKEKSIVVQGSSLRTWSYRSPIVEKVQVILSSEGRPFDADVELWNGPDNTPCKMRVYAEDGQIRPFNVIVETPRGPNTIAIRNIGQVEMPFIADVYTNNLDSPGQDSVDFLKTIQGGALKTFQFSPFVNSVAVYLKTDGRPLNARIELLQGPNNNKQVIELYSEDGLSRPFFCILETPETGNVVRIVNTAPMEFPMTASVVPYSVQID